MNRAHRDLAHRIEASQARGTVDAVLRLREAFDDTAYDAEPFGGGWLVFAPEDVPLWGAKALGFDPPVDEETIQHVERAFAARRLSAWFEVCPLADPTLDARLAARGYEALPSCEVWVRDMAAPFEHAAGDVQIEPVLREDDAAVEHFAQTVARGYAEGEPPPEWNLMMGRFGARVRDAFFARIDGETAGGGVLVVDGDLARLVFMSTLPAFRRRGVQRALMEARLNRAIELGAETVFVQCDVGSATARNAARLGFELLYTRASCRLATSPA